MYPSNHQIAPMAQMQMQPQMLQMQPQMAFMPNQQFNVPIGFVKKKNYLIFLIFDIRIIFTVEWLLSVSRRKKPTLKIVRVHFFETTK
jgi:hypothetical protein